jgi:hypothetical protein
MQPLFFFFAAASFWPLYMAAAFFKGSCFASEAMWPVLKQPHYLKGACFFQWQLLLSTAAALPSEVKWPV